jgi:hypothetical protein
LLHNNCEMQDARCKEHMSIAASPMRVVYVYAACEKSLSVA